MPSHSPSRPSVVGPRKSRTSVYEAPASPRGRRVRAAAVMAAIMAVPALAAASSLGAPTTPAVPRAIVTNLSAMVAPRVTRGACPDNMARVGESCVDKYEASLVEILDDGREVPFSPHVAPNGHHVRAVSRAGVLPQAHISMVQAKRACEASGKRLCHAKEWKAACKGPDHTRYPYGDSRVAGACVDTHRTSPMRRLHHGEHTARTLNDPMANQLDNTLETTGSTPTCSNEYGVEDMVGNIHEWTDDGSFRGGYYLDTKLNGEGCNYRTTAHAPTYYDYSTGFRCCADADLAAEGLPEGL